jgi:hypothetical protein
MENDSGNACYHSVQHLLSSSLLSINIKIKKYIVIQLCLLFFWVWNLVSHTEGGTWAQGAEEDIAESENDEVTVSRKDYTKRSFMICTSHQILLRCSNQEE